MTNPAIDLFVEEAKGVSVIDAAMALGLVKQTNKNHAGPCPKCGGNDRFSISPVRQAWNCRGCGIGGRDGISLFAHVNGHNLRSRSGFLAACSEALGDRPIPDGGERETEAERAERLARIEAQKAVNAEQAASQQKTENIWREREIEKARGLYLKAPERPVSAILGEYLRRRTGFAMHEGVFANLRLQPNATYWHGKDDRGYEIAFYAGPAMIAPFVNLHSRITGCHQTWIDLRNPPKFRAELCDDAGEPLTAKKMRGTKKGSLIPLFGLMSAARWVGGEGIENGLTIAGAEGFRLDSFYFAAGDLGNLAGPADPKSAFSHPHEVKEDARGHFRAVRVPGPVPKPDQGPDDAMQVADHVTELLLLADGDSEKWMTAAAMLRAQARLSRSGREVWEWRAPDGTDFASLMTGA
jgi:hypothetical protein